MNITVAEILAMPSFSKSKVIAGEGGLMASVDEILLVEGTDILDDVPEGSFLLATLFPILNNDFQLTNIIERLAKSGVSGLGIKFDSSREEVPEKFIVQAEDHSFPLVALPPQTDFSQQLNEFLLYKVEVHASALERRNVIHDRLMSLISLGGGYGELRTELESVLGRPIGFLDSEFSPITMHDSFPKALMDEGGLLFEKRAELKRAQEAFRVYERAGASIAFYSVRNDGKSIGYIVVSCTPDEPLAPVEQIAIEQFGTAFSVVYHRQRASIETEKTYRNELVFDLVTGKIQEESTAAVRAKNLGWRFGLPLNVVAVDTGDNQAVDTHMILEGLEREFVAMDGRIFQRILLGRYSSYLLFLIVCSDKETTETILAAVVKQLTKATNGGVSCGISQSACTVEAIQPAFREAEVALGVSRKLPDTPFMWYADTGVYRLLHSTIDRREAESFAWETLAPLFDYDRKGQGELFTTLKCIIEHNGNLKEASKALYVHYNTIRYRFEKIEQLLGKRLDGPLAYQDVSIAIKIYEMYLDGNHAAVR